MKYGIYYAYWEKEWNGDYKYYIDKISKLGFDILEISCAMLKDISDEKLKELRLDVPQVTLLAHELKKAGLDLPAGILSIEELVDNLCQLKSNM